MEGISFKFSGSGLRKQNRNGSGKGVLRYNRTAIIIECVTLRVIVVPRGLLRRIKATVFTSTP